MKSILTGAAGCLALAATTATPWMAHTGAASGGARARIDQAQTRLQGGLSVRFGASQTLVAGHDGRLTRVDLPLCTVIKRTTVTLAVAVGATRTAASITFRRSSADCDWYAFSFKHAPAVRSGQVVRLLVSSKGGEAPLWAASTSGSNPYRKGAGSWMGHPVNDFGFKTYVQS
jgi:hypothetical protein